MNRTMAVFRLFGGIEREKSFEKLFRQMGHLLEGNDDQRDAVQPVLLVSSPGGNTEEAIRIYSFLKQVPQPLVTIALGPVESAAAFVYLAGTQRMAMPTSHFMIHGGTYGVGDVPVDEMAQMAREAFIKRRIQAEIIARETTVGIKSAMRWLQRGAVFSIDEAQHHGIVHTVLTDSLFRGKVVDLFEDERIG